MFRLALMLQMERRRVYMGFGKQMDANSIVSLRRHYLPLGKIGGKPAWLNPVVVPSLDEVSCKVCKAVMPLLVQIYSSGDLEHAFHRYLYVFMCRNPACNKTGSSENFRVIRSQLDRRNPYYSYEGPISFDTEGEVDDPYFNAETYAKLCNVCGGPAKKNCARCRSTWYCTKDHQVIDWKEKHKLECQEGRVVKIQPANNNENFTVDKDNSFIFDEFGIDMDWEDVRTEINSIDSQDKEESSESEDDEESQADGDELERAKELLDKLDPKNEMSALNDLEEAKKDESFMKFTRMLKRNPKQILRYDRGGAPFIATDMALCPQKIPACELCGSRRQFEFQLTPYLLSLLNIDEVGDSVDFATVLIFTCSKFCKIKDDGYATEFVHKQDFYNVDDVGVPVTAEEED